jgi:hypothetical protein
MTETISAKPELSGLAQQLHALAADRRHSVDFALQAELAESIACGYISDVKRGPAKVLVPKDPRVLPCRYVSGLCDEVVNGRKVTRPVVRSTTSTMTDRDFVIAATLAGSITHASSHQPAAVSNQPDWVTYVMNSEHLPRLFNLCPYDLGKATTAFGDWAEPFCTMEFLIKAFRGGVDWWWENADLLFKSVSISFPNRAAYTVLAKALALAEAKLPRISGGEASDRIHKVVPKALGTSSDSKLSGAARFLSRYLEEALGKKQKLPEAVAEAIEKGKQHVNSALLTALIEWVFTTPDLRIKVGSSSWQPWSTTTILSSSPVCSSAASRFVAGLNQLGEHAPQEDLAAMKKWIQARARDTLLGQFNEVDSPDAAVGLRLIAEAVMLTSLDLGGGVTYGGGELQREEAERMRVVKWPHICINHPDRRAPHMNCNFGAFMVYDLKTSSKDRFDFPLHRVGILCDAKGRFLDYEDAVRVLEAEFDDFAEGADWGECPKDFIPAISFALEAKGLDVDRVHDVEVDESAWYPLLTDAGIENVDRLRVEFGVGPETWVAIRYPYPSQGSIAALNTDVDSTAAAFVYNAYSDFGKSCWLRHRGLIGKEDEIRVKEHDPAKDLSPDMLQDFIKFCRLVPELDKPWGEFGTYDGTGDTYVYSPDTEDDTACGVVLYRAN